jgi:signal transduction histidine kinase
MKELRLEQWEQREAGVLGTLPFVLLAICLGVSYVIGEADVLAPLWVLTLLSVGTAAWMLWWTVVHPAWRERSNLMLVYFAGLVALMAALVIVAPWYGFFTFTGYFAIVLLPERVWPLAVFAVAAVTGTSQNGGLPEGSASSFVIWGLIIVVNVVVASTIMFFAYVGDRGHQRRAQLVEELEASLRENEALQEQLVARAREDGVVDERQRMARELHDTLAQGLAGIITQLEAAEQARDTGDWRRHVDAARDLARESLTAARRSVHAMRPEPLQDARLADALAAEARRWSRLQGVRADVTTTGETRRLPPDVEVTLLRAAQEALANVAKHAAAERVGLTLSYMEDVVTLDVRDDGIGFHVNGHAEGLDDRGFGLLGMRQRVGLIHGTLAIESEPGGGTAISVSVPT